MEARARTLDERLAVSGVGGSRARGRAGRHSGVRDPRLDRWAHWFAGGDSAALDRRLAWDGLSAAVVLEALDRAGVGAAEPAGGRGTGWTSSLVRATGTGGARTPETMPAGEGDPPFAPIWTQWAATARRRLLRECPAAREQFAPAALCGLERALVRQLSGVSAVTLMERFESVRSGPDDSPSHGVFDAFVGRVRNGILWELLLDLPVLARLLTLLVETWVDTWSELARRLRRDRVALQRAFGGGRSLGRVANLEAGLSDRHAGGRQVARLRFASGVEVIYKPREMRLEAEFHGFLRWLAARGAEPPLPTLKVIARRDYGWAEVAHQVALRGEAEAREYFRRAGALLAVAHLLGASDLHMDNVVATEDGPVLVDLEALFQPDLVSGVRASAGGGAGTRGESALRTGLLTFPWSDPQGCFVDIGGLRGTGGYLVAERARSLRDVNSDSMTLTAGAMLGPPQLNDVWVGGRRVSPGEHAAEIVEGFVAMYRSLLALRPALATARGGIGRFAGARTRIVLRPSQTYASLLVGLLAPRYLRDGLERSLAMEVLHRGFAASSTRPLLWPLAVEERQALEGLDIPVLLVGVDEVVLTSRSGERIAGAICRSGLRGAKERLATLSEEDLEAQVTRVGRALRLPEGRHSLRLGGDGPPPRTDGLASARIPRDLLLDVARDLAGDAARSLRRSRRTDLYGGALGTALCLAAWSAVSGDQRHRDAALRALRRVEREVGSGERPESARLGACTGLGGTVYGLVASGVLLEEAELVAGAARLAARINRTRIAADRRLDVEGGAAGAILGLLALHAAVGGSDQIERAVACGEHVLRRSHVPGDGQRAWRGADGVARTGFAHGAAGIAWALAALFGATREARFATACLEACAFERAAFDATLGSWPVAAGAHPSAAGRHVAMSGWCHGAAGIALARAAILAQVSAPPLFEDLRVATEIAWRSRLGGLDHLCCGSFGTTESLLTIGQLGHLADAVPLVSSRVTALVGRAMTGGAFSLSRGRTGSPVAGLFHGAPGIGYALLRLAAPDVVPPLLVFLGRSPVSP